MGKGSGKNWIEAYAAAIEDGSVIVGDWVRRLYGILTEGIASGRYIYDGRKADRAIRFIEEFCHHCEGRDDLIRLELWQKAMVAVIFGIVDADGFRIWREVFIVIGRKNGKTLLAAAMIAYLAYIDGEYGAKIYCLAPKLDQAMIVYDNFYQMILKEPELSDVTKKRRSDIYISETNTAIKPLAFSAKKSDGFNPHAVINDELGSWVGDAGLKQYDVMKSAQGARRQPLIISITTAGYVHDGIYDELLTRSTAFLKGHSAESRLCPFLYLIDDPGKWRDLRELRKSNPNMGVSVSADYYREEIAIAEKNISKRREFLTKYCNIKQNSSMAWLDFSEVMSAVRGAEGLTLADFRGCYAVGGVDLSQTVDLTAASVVIRRDGTDSVFTRFFMPAERLEKAIATDRVPYDVYVQRGFITLSGEHCVDYRYVYRFFVDLLREHEIYTLKIGYDRYSSAYLVNDLKEFGFHTDDVYQGYNLSGVLDEFKGELKNGKVKIIGDNQLLAAHFLNVALKEDSETRKKKPVKIEQRARIDGFMSVIDAWTVRQKYYPEIGALIEN